MLLLGERLVVSDAADDAGAPGLVWVRLASAAPPSRPELGLAAVLDATTDLLDQHGTAALTMRALAGRLDVAVGTLYRYARTKDELFDLVLDRALGELPVPAVRPGERWRDAAYRHLQELRDLALRRPWVPELFADRPAIGPHGLRRVEGLCEVVAEAGFAGAEVYAVQELLTDLVMGLTHIQNGFRRWVLTEPAGVADVRAYVIGATAEHPITHAALTRLESGDPGDRPDAFGLAADAVLDGLQGRLDASPVDATAPSPSRTAD